MVRLNFEKVLNKIIENKILILMLSVFFVLAMTISFLQSIWLDEGLSIEFSSLNLREIVKLSMLTDLHPPLYNIFLHYSGIFFGKAVWNYRFWSVIFYISTAVFLFNYLKYKRFLEFKNKIYLFVLFFLLSPFALYYASESRSYMLTILVSLIQFGAFDKLFDQSQNYKKQAFIYVGFSIIGIYLFYPVLFLLISQFFYVVLLKRGYFKKFILPWALIFVSYLPWMYLVILNRLNEAPGHFLSIPWWQIPAIIFVGFSGGRVAITDLNHLKQYWPTILISLAYALNFLGIFLWWITKENRDLFKRLIFLITFPIGISLIISYFRFPIFDPRYYSQIFPLFILVLVLSNYYLLKKYPKIWRVLTAYILLADLIFIGLYIFNPFYQREPWRSVVPILEDNLNSNDAVVFIGYRQPPPTYLAYQKKSVEIISTYPDDLQKVTNYEQISQHLVNSLADNNRIWYSQFLEWQKDPEYRIRDIIERDFNYIKTFGFFKVKFDLYERK